MMSEVCDQALLLWLGFLWILTLNWLSTLVCSLMNGLHFSVYTVCHKNYSSVAPKLHDTGIQITWHVSFFINIAVM